MRRDGEHAAPCLSADPAAVRDGGGGDHRSVHDGSHLRHQPARARLRLRPRRGAVHPEFRLQAPCRGGIGRCRADQRRIFRSEPAPAQFCDQRHDGQRVDVQSARGAARDLSGLRDRGNLPRHVALRRVVRWNPVRQWIGAGGNLHRAGLDAPADRSFRINPGSVRYSAFQFTGADALVVPDNSPRDRPSGRVPPSG